MLPATTDLLSTFLGEAWETISALEGAKTVLSGGGTAVGPEVLQHDTLQHEALQHLVMLSHRLHGSAGMYGFPQIANLTGLLERLLEQAGALGVGQRRSLAEFTQRATVCMTAALERITQTGAEGDVGYELTQLGASDLLVELLRANPQAFVRRAASAHIAQDHDASEPPVSVASAGSPVSVEETLRAFVQNDAETWSYFAPEVTEHLEVVAAAIEVMQTDHDPGFLHQLFRSLHTIKGAAYSVGCPPIGALAHRLEDLLVAVRDGHRAWDASASDAVVHGADLIGAMMAVAEGRPNQFVASLERTRTVFEVALGSRDLGLEVAATPSSAQIENTVQDGVPDDAPGTDAVVAEAQSAAQAKPQATMQRGATLRVGLEKIEHLLDLSGETVIARMRFERLLGRYRSLTDQLEGTRSRFDRTATEFVDRYLNPRLSSSAAQTDNQAETGPTIGRGLSASEMFSELEFDRYDDLNILARSIGEMANDLGEVQNQLVQLTDRFKSELEDLEKLTRTVRGEVGRMRLVSIGRLMNRLRTQARGMIGHKKFRVELEGETVELDNLVLEGLSSVMLHVISNAVAHGIETPEVRAANGKAEEGLIQIRAHQRGNFVFIEVQDDGAGIDVNAVRRQAVARNLRTQEELEQLDDQAALALIFLPGLSTSNTVNETSGRGVGMDAVWSGLRRLKGEITLESQPGRGTLVHLKVPLTLVVSEVLLLECDGSRFALPRESVRSLRAVDRDAILERDGVAQTLIEGQSVRVLSLHKLLGLNTPSLGKRASLVTVEIGARSGVPGTTGTGSGVPGTTGTTLVALEVDGFIGLEQAVVKPLEAPFHTLEHLLGAMVDSDGQVILVLDAAGVTRLEARDTARSTRPVRTATAITPVAPRAPIRAACRVLLVDDSLSVRRIVGERIKRLGFEVVLAADGQEALDLALQHDFDAIITDLEMPKLNGFELLESLRRREQFALTPMAMLTSRASDKHERLAFELGVNEYLTKPLDDAKLMGFLARIDAPERVGRA
jgi:chemosensory pili system protein ChpA (sensor histidine kinase/response regulator)